MRLIYTIGILLYSFAIHIASVFKEKARLWVNGRRNLLSIIEKDFANNSSKTIWIHSASLGEFEQGRSVIESLKRDYPQYKIVLTFFSPSGYEVRKNDALADFVYYLPIDTPGNAQKFISIVQPKIAVFIKYEFWFNYINELHKRQIPSFFISAIFRHTQHFFKKSGVWQKSHLKSITHFFVQNKESLKLLKDIGIQQVSVSGDTRFDRVLAIATQAQPNAMVAAFKQQKKLFLAGSTWAQDEKYLLELVHQNPELKILIAPHIIDQAHIGEIESLFQNPVLYSKANLEEVANHQVLIVDTMGMLSSLYQYADYALIGGGFGAGIHNTLEAATFGMPVFIGPNFRKFQEAKDLLQIGVAQVFENEQELVKKFENIQKEEKQYEKIVFDSKEYVKSKSGATDVIINKIASFL